jgi:hypothetical protein
MAPKKNVPLVHKGKRSWWDDSFKTNCGIRFKKGDHRAQGLFEPGKPCADCASGKKHQH